MGVTGKLFLLVCIAIFSVVLFSGIFYLSGGANADLKLQQAVQSISLFILPAIVFSYLCSEKPVVFLWLNVRSKISDILLVVFIFLLATPFINWISELNLQIKLPESLSGIESWMRIAEQQAAELTNKMLDVSSVGGMIAVFFVMALLASIGEELMFRGAILRTLNSKLGIHLSVWISAIIFSAIHMQFYGFIPRMFLGAFFAYIVLYNGNIRPAMWVHFFNNAMYIIIHHYESKSVFLSNLNTLGSNTTWWMGLLSGIVVVVCVLFLRKYWKTRDGIVQ